MNKLIKRYLDLFVQTGKNKYLNKATELRKSYQFDLIINELTLTLGE